MNGKKISRRVFLRAAAITLGAGVLTCGGLTALLPGERQSEKPMITGFPEISINGTTKSGEKTMMENNSKKILVAYASAAGSTGGVAEAIGRTLAEQPGDGQTEVTVDVRPVQSITSLDGYSAVVVGSAIHGGKWLPEAVEFIKTQQSTLRQLPTAFFLVGMMPAAKGESNQKFVEQFLAEERALVQPLAEGRFVGALFPGKEPGFTGFGLRFFLWYCGLGVRGGDFRNWDAIHAWAASTRPMLLP